MKAKKLLSLLLAGTMAMTMMAGVCVTAHAEEASALTYNGQDVSEPVDLVMYIVGDLQPDHDMVMEEINKILKEEINATLTVKSLSLSDYTTKYALTIAGGEEIDMIYTSTWAYYQAEANKGAFAEVTEDVITNYMPLHDELQDAPSWGQAEIGGKVYFVPSNLANVNANAIVIRGDLREKYGLERLETIDDLKAYYDAVAADTESGVTFAYNASQNNDMSKLIFLHGKNNWARVDGTLQNYFSYVYEEGMTADDVFWIYDTEEYLEFAKQMKEWSANGYWSKSSIANATDVKEAFLNGTSASYSQNLGTVGATASTMVAANPEWSPEVYDLTPDADRFRGLYVGDGIAVLANSQNQERAFMAIDLMKFDERVYNLIRHGIEGYHYNKVGEEYWSEGEHLANYTFGNAFSWGIKNTLHETTRDDTFPDQVTIGDVWVEKAIDSPTAAFAFDDTNVKNELANLQSVYTQYIPLLDLGLAEDVEGTIEEFHKQAEIAGLEKIKEEVKNQLTAYFEGK